MGIEVTQNNSAMQLEGDLTFSTAPKAINAGLVLLRSAAPIKTLDFEGVQRMDSAGLAFVMAMLREAEKTARRLDMKNLPQNMQAVVSVYGLESVIPASAFQSV